MKTLCRTFVTVSAFASLIAVSLSPQANAAPLRWYHGHGDIHSFHAHDYPVWRGGRWYHGWRSGRLGWWWTVGSSYYFYPHVVYPYPNPYVPPTVVIQTEAAPPPAPVFETVPPPMVAQPQAIYPNQPTPVAPGQQVAEVGQPQNWYYCRPSGGYYPYVASCREPWTPVPAEPAVQAVPESTAPGNSAPAVLAPANTAPANTAPNTAPAIE